MQRFRTASFLELSTQQNKAEKAFKKNLALARARGTEPHAHRIQSTSFCLVVT